MTVFVCMLFPCPPSNILGFLPGIFGTTHGIVQFVAYEDMKRWLRARRPPDSPLPSAEVFVAGALSKILAAAALYPYQVVRSRVQDVETRTSSVVETIRLLIRYARHHPTNERTNERERTNETGRGGGKGEC